MKNKWKYIIGMCILALILSACSDSKDQKNNTDDETQQTPSEDQNENGKNNPDENEDENNGENNQDENNNTEQDESDDESVNNNDSNNQNEEVEEKPSLSIDIVNDDSITVLVNKQNSLSESYAPSDLVTVSVPTVLENPEVKQMRKVAADALKEMFDKAKESNIYLHARSGYRSYQTQVQLFNNYVSRHGEEAANRYSARPGQSEHQTGLVMDVTSESVNFQLTEQFGETKEGIWLRDNAHKFGFIIRYPKDMEHITGYIYEPWHIRYLGVEVATKVYESGLTYEEFLVKEGILDDVNTAKKSE